MFKFRVQVPRDSKEAKKLQEKLGHTKWTDAKTVKRDQLYEYETFNILPKGSKPPEGYQQIKVRFVYDIKHDLRHKARLIARGDMTPPDKDQEYAGVVSLRTVRLALLLGELHGLECMVGDVWNAYLEYTQKRRYIL